jgi:hypothetical protein
MVEISTDPLQMFVRLWVCFNPRSTTPGDIFAKERMQAVFRTYVNGTAAQKRQPVPWNGYISNPHVPGPQSYSVELQNLQITKDLSQGQRALIPAKLPGWKDGRLTYMMSWNATSYVRIDQLPKDPSDKQKEACKLFDAFLKAGLGGKFYILVANGDKITNQMNQLASAPTPFPPSYWPWMNGSFGVGDDGLDSPLAFNLHDFDRSHPASHSWIHKAFIERDSKALLAEGVKAAETNPSQVFSDVPANSLY